LLLASLFIEIPLHIEAVQLQDPVLAATRRLAGE
jgi:hypothetical protein